MDELYDKRTIIIGSIAGWVCGGVDFFNRDAGSSFSENILMWLIAPLGAFMVMFLITICLSLPIMVSVFNDKELSIFFYQEAKKENSDILFRLSLRITELLVIGYTVWVLLARKNIL